MKRHVTGFATLAFLLAAPAAADEGMWLPRQTPGLAAMLKAKGMQIDPATLANLQKAPMNAIASLGGCSAAFLSPEGLVATNHHCVYGSIQYNSKPGQDYLENGFLARALGDELPAAPGTRVFVIEDLRDVTSEMNRGVSPKLAGVQRFEQMEANRKALISACEKQASRRCDVRAYYGGAHLFPAAAARDQGRAPGLCAGRRHRQFRRRDRQLDVAAPHRRFRLLPRLCGAGRTSAPFACKRALQSQVVAQDRDRRACEGERLRDGRRLPGTDQPLWSPLAEAKFNCRRADFRSSRGCSTNIRRRSTKATAGRCDATIKYASIIQGADNYKKKYLGEMAGADRIGPCSPQGRGRRPEYRAWIAAEPKRQAGCTIRRGSTQLVAEATKLLDNAHNGLLVARPAARGAARNLYRWSKERQKPDAQRESGLSGPRPACPTEQR
jgi:hypothetical protein